MSQLALESRSLVHTRFKSRASKFGILRFKDYGGSDSLRR